ncbi:MAG: hypothetical protein J4452_03325 [Candidatus Aenigmarchaeota archaeon]|nr:hypothetical protein [Candidatus Aenigmarchaeota archaeon]
MGTRLSEISQYVQKCMFPVNGIPLLGHHIDRATSLGVEENNIHVVVGYRADDARNFLRRYHPKVNQLPTMNVKGGTGTGLLSTEDAVGRNWSWGYVFYGDNYFTDPLTSWREKEEPIVAVRSVADLSRYGAVLSKDGYLQDIVEKKITGSGHALVGAMKEPPEIFDHIKRVKPNDGEIFLTDAIMSLNEERAHRVHEIDGSWYDVGSKDTLKLAINGDNHG